MKGSWLDGVLSNYWVAGLKSTWCSFLVHMVDEIQSERWKNGIEKLLLKKRIPDVFEVFRLWPVRLFSAAVVFLWSEKAAVLVKMYPVKFSVQICFGHNSEIFFNPLKWRSLISFFLDSFMHMVYLSHWMNEFDKGILTEAWEQEPLVQASNAAFSLFCSWGWHCSFFHFVFWFKMAKLSGGRSYKMFQWLNQSIT